MKPTSKTFHRKRVIFLGAGNANLQCLQKLAKHPQTDWETLLINPDLKVPYSAMVPGCISGLYRRDEVEIDLFALCAPSGTTFIRDEVIGINEADKTLTLKAHPPFFYDLLSINSGSIPQAESGIPARPLGKLLDEIESIDREIAANKSAYLLAIVGGGAGGCEIALAIRKRYDSQPQVSVSVIHEGAHLLSENSKASFFMEQAFLKAGIQLQLGKKAETGPYDKMIWATSAKPLPWVLKSSLAKTEVGFLKVRDTLQSESHPDIFVAGDANHFSFHPLPKSGVYSVRQGPILFKNLIHKLRGESLIPYRPQKRFLRIYNTSDGEAILHYGEWVTKSSSALKLKNKIDKKWIHMFEMKKTKMSAEEEMRCGGCGSKVPSAILENVFSRLNIPKSPEVILGSGDAENASVHRVPEKKLEVQSVDFFKEVVSDPFLTGKIAALNAVSDLHAMGATPFGALALVALPLESEKLQEEKLFQLMSGSLEVFKEERVSLLGGILPRVKSLRLVFP